MLEISLLNLEMNCSGIILFTPHLDIANLEAAIEENQEAQGNCGSDYVKLQQLQDELAELETRLEDCATQDQYWQGNSSAKCGLQTRLPIQKRALCALQHMQHTQGSHPASGPKRNVDV